MTSQPDDRFRNAGLAVTETLTLVNFGRGGPDRHIEYLVVHYVGATGGAADNAAYYRSVYRGASAHYFVDFDGSVVQVVRDEDVAWHCGTRGTYKHPWCRNLNSIGIELCVRNGHGNVQDTGPHAGWYFETATLQAAQRLLRLLMGQYGIAPDHVLRHFDVTGKMCPAPFCNGQLDWEEFKRGIREAQPPPPAPSQGGGTADPAPAPGSGAFAGDMARYLAGRAALPGSGWSCAAREWALRRALVRGDEKGRVAWGGFVTLEQVIQVLYRFGRKTK